MAEVVLFSREDAARDLPQLRGWSNQLMETIVEPIFQRDILRLNNNPFRLMCLSFLTRQFTHAQSLVALQHNRDMTLIARTMLEGMVLLLWVKQDSANRARLWRDYTFIHDWRLLKKHRNAGITVSDQDWERAIQNSREFGEPFYTRQAREAIALGRTIPDDPYWKYWQSQERISWLRIFTDVGHEDWYQNMYVGLCRWFHWECPSIALSIGREGEDFIYSAVREDDEYYAIMIGIISVHVTLQIVNPELGLELTDQINRYRELFHDWLRTCHSDFQIPLLEPLIST